MKHSNSFWKRTIIGCSLLGMVIVTALPAQAATLNERTVSAVSTYTGTNVALATSKTAAIILPLLLQIQPQMMPPLPQARPRPRKPR